MANPPKKQPPYPFTPAFELAVIRQILHDPILGGRVLAHIEPDRFANAEITLMADVARGVFTRTGKSPSTIAVLQSVRALVEEGKATADRVTNCALVLESADEQPLVDSSFVQETLLAEARASAVWTALDNGLRSFKRREFDLLTDSLLKAAAIGKIDSSPGTDVMESLAERTANRIAGKIPPRFGTGLLELDDRILGGLAPGELGCVIGAPKRGKSMLLNSIAVHNLHLGGTVLYYSLEMGELDIIARIDASVSRVAIDELWRKADYVQAVMEDWHAGTGGKVIIKQLPGYTTTTRDIESHMQMLRSEKNIKPTVLIVDSGDFMSASEGGAQRHDLELGSVYSELRGLGVRWNVPVWTASWAKRESLAKKEVTMGDVAESWRKVGISDLGVAICGTEEEFQDNIFRLYVAWCRFMQGGFALGPYKSAFREGRMIEDSAAGGESF